MRHLTLIFKGIDDWNRPIWQDIETKSFYGSTDTLFPHKTIASTETEINSYFRQNTKEIEYFGNRFGCEPSGGRNGIASITIISNNEYRYPTDQNDRGGTGHGDISFSDADSGL